MVNQSKPTVAIFGGSFDPPHAGHQLIVENATRLLDIDKLLVVPAYLSPFKTSTLADAHTRLTWCHILFDSISMVKVVDFEVKEGKSTVTADSVKHLCQAYHIKYLIIGSDNLSTLTKWHAFEWLNETITWVIVTRENYNLDMVELRSWKLLTVDAPISSTQIRTEKDLQFIDDKIKESVKQLLHKGSQ